VRLGEAEAAAGELDHQSHLLTQIQTKARSYAL
jgi:hypothetical protein